MAKFETPASAFFSGSCVDGCGQLYAPACEDGCECTCHASAWPRWVPSPFVGGSLYWMTDPDPEKDEGFDIFTLFNTPVMEWTAKEGDAHMSLNALVVTSLRDTWGSIEGFFLSPSR